MNRFGWVLAVGLVCPAVAFAAADADGDGFDALRDCDDTDAAVYPGATEVVNGIDDDCDGLVDETGDTGTRDTGRDTGGWYGDADGDGWTTGAGDCDDRDPQVHPGAPEVPNGVDDDCDGLVDESGGTDTGVRADDADGDGWTAADGDCDDRDPTVNPGATEVPNGVDDDCDGLVDEGATSGGSGRTGDDDDDDEEEVEAKATGGFSCTGSGGSYALLLLPLALLARRRR